MRFYREKKHSHSGLIIARSLIVMILGIDILKLTGRNQGRVFKFRRGCLHAMQLHYFETKLPNLKLKNRPKQLLGSLPVDISLPVLGVRIFSYNGTQYWNKKRRSITTIDASVVSLRRNDALCRVSCFYGAATLLIATFSITAFDSVVLLSVLNFIFSVITPNVITISVVVPWWVQPPSSLLVSTTISVLEIF